MDSVICDVDDCSSLLLSSGTYMTDDEWLEIVGIKHDVVLDSRTLITEILENLLLDIYLIYVSVKLTSLRKGSTDIIFLFIYETSIAILYIYIHITIYLFTSS